MRNRLRSFPTRIKYDGQCGVAILLHFVILKTCAPPQTEQSSMNSSLKSCRRQSWSHVCLCLQYSPWISWAMGQGMWECIHELPMVGSMRLQHGGVSNWQPSNNDYIMLHQAATLSYIIKNVIQLTNFFQCTNDIYCPRTICMMMGVQTLTHLDKVFTYVSLVQTLPIMWCTMTFADTMLHPISRMYCGTSPCNISKALEET